ncbi:MAG: heavy-metal-associated domain-containing protein [Ignavibacteriales bacterium]|nr:heavy-metal-associated domain-containing protein [Ignavibacteriales bacterium]
MIEKSIKINGMNCNHCVMSVKKELSKLTLESAEVTIGSAKVVYDETKANETQIEAAIVEAGFEVAK